MPKNINISYVICLSFLMGSTLFAQDLEPRRWTPLPAGTTIFGIGYGHTSGDVGFDPLLEIEDTKVKRDSLIMSYTRYFALAGKLARFDAFLPFQKAKWDGLLSGETASVQRNGLGDPRFRLSINLLGAPTPGSEVSDDSKKPINTVVGAAIAVGVPWGEYHEEKLLNLGTNLYTIRPQIGVVHTHGSWSYELTGSIFFFTDNDRFFDGKKLEIDPFYAAQAHIIHVFKPGVWGSLSAGYGQGGASKVNGVSRDDEREGLISALSFGIPVAANQGVTFGYIWAKTKTDTEPRSNTNTFAVAWAIRF